ncbi:uncharacterized protein LOC143200153 [Rhynchophorus ferrugineus]|uniref:Uncharacterized protein n=1 Tax=Rhynchophorus ferrugineus TaxID=354439 RepID=A0A834MA07_RHYFE|nr:hypothetical protein GWI33_015178 [Rhynchophorus ferrugineus]
MKLLYVIVLILMAVLHIDAHPEPFLSKLFGGYSSGGYGGGYYKRPRSYGRSYEYGDGGGGGERYKAICRVHAVDSLAFPGRIGRPVCP